jgi:hypothetical protein
MALADYKQLEHFDSLPGDAVVLDALAAKLLSISTWTLKRENPVRAVQVSERRRGRRVGDLRNLIRGASAPKPDVSTRNSASDLGEPAVATAA